MMETKDKNAVSCCDGTCEAQPELATVRPAYQVDERGDGISVSVALPGVRKEDLTVSATDDVLTIGADRTDAVPEAWETRQEVAKPDRYELRLRLHRTLDPARIEATLEDGVLKLAVLRREEAAPRAIAVK